MTELSRRQHVRALLLIGPGAVWMAAFVFAVVLVGGISFFSTGEYGQIEHPLTIEHYQRFAGHGSFGWDPLYPGILGRSVMLAAASTAVCICLAIPMAFFLAQLPARWKTAGLVIVTVPLWTNLLVRTYAWELLLSRGGTLSTLWVHLGGNADGLFPGHFAVYAALICDYLPFLVMPVYASVEKIDWCLAEAAQDLGAPPAALFRHAIWPQIRAGVAAGAVLVFVPATAQFIIPDLLGGARTILIGNVIQQQFGSSQNWPFGSAAATITMVVVLTGLWILARAVGKKERAAP